MIIGIDHGYYAIKSRNFSFPAGVTAYAHEPYTLKNTLQIGGKYFVCGTGRQPIDLSGSAIGYHLIEFITMGQGSATDTFVRTHALRTNPQCLKNGVNSSKLTPLSLYATVSSGEILLISS